MSEAVALGQFCSIGTDANIGVPAALVRYLYDPSVNNMASEQSANWDEKTYLEIAEGNKKTVTTGIYSEAMASMLNDVIKVCDVIRSEFCVGFSDGNKIFEAARDIISQGKHAIISFENVLDFEFSNKSGFDAPPNLSDMLLIFAGRSCLYLFVIDSDIVEYTNFTSLRVLALSKLSTTFIF